MNLSFESLACQSSCSSIRKLRIYHAYQKFAQAIPQLLAGRDGRTISNGI